jgi:DMSO reductase anchor subunit
VQRTKIDHLLSTASGLGCGLLILLGVMGAAGLIAADRGFALAAFGLAFATAVLGLVHSAPSRSSWVVPERVAIAATYLAGGIFAFGWVTRQVTDGWIGWAGVFGAVAALAGIVCAGMIHAGPPGVATRPNRWIVAGFVTLALATGSLWLAALARLFDIAHPAITHLPVALIISAWIVKTIYWRSLTDTPRQAIRLRRTAQALAFAMPLVLTELEMFWPDAPASLHAALAVISACIGTAGVAMERYLLFSEARPLALPDTRSEEG